MTNDDIIYMVAIVAVICGGIMAGVVFLIDRNADENDR